MRNGRRGQNIDLALHLTQRISGHAPRVPNRGTHGSAGDAITQCNVTHLVHGDAAHPAIAGIRSVRALLVESETGSAVSQLVPTDTGLAGICSRGDSVVSNERFVT